MIWKFNTTYFDDTYPSPIPWEYPLSLAHPTLSSHFFPTHQIQFVLPIYSWVCGHPCGCDSMLKTCVSLILERTFNKFKNLMAIYWLCNTQRHWRTLVNIIILFQINLCSIFCAFIISVFFAMLMDSKNKLSIYGHRTLCLEVLWRLGRFSAKVYFSKVRKGAWEITQLSRVSKGPGSIPSTLMGDYNCL